MVFLTIGITVVACSFFKRKTLQKLSIPAVGRGGRESNWKIRCPINGEKPVIDAISNLPPPDYKRNGIGNHQFCTCA